MPGLDIGHWTAAPGQEPTDFFTCFLCQNQKDLLTDWRGRLHDVQSKGNSISQSNSCREHFFDQISTGNHEYPMSQKRADHNIHRRRFRLSSFIFINIYFTPSTQDTRTSKRVTCTTTMRTRSMKNKTILAWAFALVVFATFAPKQQPVSRATMVHTSTNKVAATFPSTPSMSTREDVVLVLIAFGKASETFIADRALESIRGAGKYDGYVLIITDAPEGRYENPDDPRLFVHHDSIPDELQRATVAATSKEESKKLDALHKLAYKRFKTQSIELIEKIPALDTVEHVVYMDMDIVIGQELNLFMHYAAEAHRIITENPIQHSILHAFPQPGRRKGEEFHSGVLVLHRSHSKACLHAWQALIVSGDFMRDQPALGQVYRNPQDYNCQIYPLDGQAFLLFPTLDDMIQNRTKTFVHVTNTHRAKIIDDKIQEDYFRNVIGVQHTESNDF
eukprot:scaffold7106_cov279-Amphora_coffeaeformis.AAC.4